MAVRVAAQRSCSLVDYVGQVVIVVVAACAKAHPTVEHRVSLHVDSCTQGIYDFRRNDKAGRKLLLLKWIPNQVWDDKWGKDDNG